MNPSMPNFSHHQNPNKGNSMEGFSGYPLFTHPMPFGLSGQIPVFGVGAPMHHPLHHPMSSVTQPTQHIPIQPQSEKMNLALDFLEQVKLIYQDQPYVYTQFLDIMKEFKNQSIDTNGVIDRVKTIFKGHPELVSGFNHFLPPQLKINIKDVQETMEPQQQILIDTSEKDDKKAEFDHARSYVKKIKQRFHSQPHIYKSFLELLHTFSRNQQSLTSVYERVSQLFEGHKDLLEEFAQFLPDTSGQVETKEKMLSPIKTRRSKNTEKVIYEDQVSEPIQYEKEEHQFDRSYGTYEELQNFFKIKQTLPASDYQEFLKVLELFNAEALTSVDLYYLVKEILKDTDPVLIGWFKKFVQVDDLVEDEEPGGYLADFDWSKSERLGTSYRSTPEKWRQWKCSGRIGNPICKDVLNDLWISVPTGSEDGTFKNSRKNQYEELLFKCEDDRYEMDLLIETNLTTIRRLEEIYLQIKDMTYEERALFKLVSSDFSILHTNAIKLIYDYRSDDILKLLYSKPEATIPTIIERLKQKDIEWNEDKKEWNFYWKNMFENNFTKTLDYQSVYFKQEEKKNLSQKTLISELKESFENISKQNVLKTESEFSNEPLLEYEIKNMSLISDIKVLLELTFDNILPKGNKFRFNKFYDDFICTFFKIDNATGSKSPESTKEEEIDEKLEESLYKPLWTHTDKSNDKLTSMFLGNNSYYIMFRYFIILYNRLNEAWNFAAQEKRIRYVPEPIHSTNAILDKDAMETEQKVENKEEYQCRRYRQFLYNIELLLSNAIEQSDFEAKCRKKFGSHSYTLFTIDRLLILLSKQIQSILTEDVTKRLMSLYFYEQSKIQNFSESIYLNNCREILDRENKICVFKFNSSKNNLSIGYMDISNMYVSIEQNDEFSQYIHVLVNGPCENNKNSNPPVFLKRNLLNSNIDENNVDISYDLGCKIIPLVYKLRYIENTEDYFHRRKKKGTENK